MKTVITAALALSLAACASSHVLVGQKRAPIPVEQVQVYLDPPARYEQVALLDSTSRGSMALTPQQRTNKAIERLKAEAAKLGANGVLLQGVGSQTTGGVGYTDPGTGVTSISGAIHKSGSGIAIFVPEG